MTRLMHIMLLGSILCSAGSGSEDYIRTERLTDRVIIAYRPGTGRMNIVAVQSQKGLVVIDTGMSPRIMAPIKKRIEKTFGREDWAYVINTHAHMHHAGGNCLFKNAVIIGHDNLPQDMQWLIDKQTDEILKREALDSNTKTIRSLEGMLPKVTGNPQLAKRIRGEIEFFKLNALDMEEGFEIVKPTVMFSDKYTLDLGDVRLELVYFGKGHSLSDILIYIPQEGTLVTGAIVYLRGHLPGITERAELKDVHRYIAVLDEFLTESVRIDHVIASHSRPLARDDLKHVRDYYQTMLDGIRSVQREGLTIEQAKVRFSVRNQFRHFYQKQTAGWSNAKQDRNINVLWRLLKEEKRKKTK